MKPVLIVDQDAFESTVVQNVLLSFSQQPSQAVYERAVRWLRRVYVPWAARVVTATYITEPGATNTSMGTLDAEGAERTAAVNMLAQVTPVSELLLSQRDYVLHRQQQQRITPGISALFGGAGSSLRVKAFDQWSAAAETWVHYEAGGLCVSIGITEELVNQLHHICEALIAQHPNVNDYTRISVPQAALAAHRWTQELWRRAVESGGQRTQFAPFRVDSNTWRVSRLEDKAAYESEGAAMHHCVASYWGRTGVTIYNLSRAVPRAFRGDSQDVDPDAPDAETVFVDWSDIHWDSVATLEVRGGTVEQVRGPRNASVDDAAWDAIETFARYQHIIARRPARMAQMEIGRVEGMRIIADPLVAGRTTVSLANSNIGAGQLVVSAGIGNVTAAAQSASQLRMNLLRDLQVRFDQVVSMEVEHSPNIGGHTKLSISGFVTNAELQALIEAVRQQQQQL